MCAEQSSGGSSSCTDCSGLPEVDEAEGPLPALIGKWLVVAGPLCIEAV